jgi:hypothetical protein
LLGHQELQPFIDGGRDYFDDFRSYNTLCDEWILVHPGLEIRPRNIVRHDSTAGVGLKTADEHKHSVIEAAFDPILVGLHESAGLSSVARELEQYDEHRVSLL